MLRVLQRPSGSVAMSHIVLPVLLRIFHLKSPAEISATARTSQGVAIADIHGGVRIMGPKFESSTSWKAHTDGRVTHLVERKGILVTLGVCVLSTTRLPFQD